MCVGNLFGGSPKPPAPPPRMRPAPPLRSPAPPPVMPTPDKIMDEEGYDDKLSTRKKKALEIQKVQKGVKEFGAINPASTPDTPQGGVTLPSP